MNLLFRKYEFIDEDEANTLISEVTDIENPTHVIFERIDLKYLKHGIIINPDTGEPEVTYNIPDNPYCVDILWLDATECPIELQPHCFQGTTSSHLFEGYETLPYTMGPSTPV